MDPSDCIRVMMMMMIIMTVNLSLRSFLSFSQHVSMTSVHDAVGFPVSQPHIRSGFSVYTRLSERCGTLALHPLLRGPTAQTQRLLSLVPSPSSLLSLFLLWSSCSLACPLFEMVGYPAPPPRRPLCATPALTSAHQHNAPACAAGRHMHQNQCFSLGGGGDWFTAPGACGPVCSSLWCILQEKTNKKTERCMLRSVFLNGIVAIRPWSETALTAVNGSGDSLTYFVTLEAAKTQRPLHGSAFRRKRS